MNVANTKQLDRIWRFFSPLFVLFIGLDQLSKAWALENLELYRNVDFGFALSYNDGIVFGFDMPAALVYLMTVFVLGLGVYLVVENKLWRNHWHLTGLALLLAGALGNLIDRVRFGYVVDFIKVYWWPTFNLADTFIVIAVVLFAWEFLIREDGVAGI